MRCKACKSTGLDLLRSSADICLHPTRKRKSVTKKRNLWNPAEKPRKSRQISKHPASFDDATSPVLPPRAQSDAKPKLRLPLPSATWPTTPKDHHERTRRKQQEGSQCDVGRIPRSMSAETPAFPHPDSPRSLGRHFSGGVPCWLVGPRSRVLRSNWRVAGYSLRVLGALVESFLPSTCVASSPAISCYTCIHRYVCMYACMHACMYVCMYVGVPFCVCARVYMQVSVLYTFRHICLYLSCV